MKKRKRDSLKKTIEELKIDDFMKGAVPATKFRAVTEQILKGEREKLIDEERLKRDRVWSVLARQVVGAEVIKGGKKKKNNVNE